jgi:hypothetical protein
MADLIARSSHSSLYVPVSLYRPYLPFMVPLDRLFTTVPAIAGIAQSV